MPDQRLNILFEKCMNSTASPEESKEFMDLILLHENEEALRELISKSMYTENEYSLAPSSSASIVKTIFNKAETVESRATRQRKKIFIAAYSIAACVILLIGLSFFFSSVLKSKSIQPQVAGMTKKAISTRKDVLPGTNQAVLILGNGRRIMLDSMANGIVIDQPGATLVKRQGALTYEKEIASGDQPEYNTVEVPRKGQYQLVLSDGTRVWLNASSSLYFPQAFTGKARIVYLKGEGYFEIAKDPTKPFHVIAGKTDIQALGTHFNVMSYDNEASLQTTLLEGSVKIKHNNDSCILKPGQEAYVFQSSKHMEVKPADVDEVIAWKNGYFLFNQKTPLSTIMRQLERWYDIEVSYDGTIPDPNFGGGIQRTLPLSGVLSVLEESGIKLQFIDNHLILLK